MYASLALALPNDAQSSSGLRFGLSRSKQTDSGLRFGLSRSKQTEPIPSYPDLQIVWRRSESTATLEPPVEVPVSAPKSDVDLLAQVARRDSDALAVLYDRHGRTAFGVAYRILEDSALAEDTVQDAFLALWRQADSYRPERGAVRTWLMAITRNAAIDRRRGRQGRTYLDRPLEDVTAQLVAPNDPHAETMTTLLGQEVQTALAALPAEQRQVIDLAFFGGLTHHEIADRLGLPLGTVKGRIRLALHKLQTLLSPFAPTMN